jgi:hypothetical protein
MLQVRESELLQGVIEIEDVIDTLEVIVIVRNIVQ